jgi:hypothetical protein
LETGAPTKTRLVNLLDRDGLGSYDARQSREGFMIVSRKTNWKSLTEPFPQNGLLFAD